MKFDACRWLEKPQVWSHNKHAVLLGASKEWALLSQIQSIWLHIQKSVSQSSIEHIVYQPNNSPWQDTQISSRGVTQQLDLFKKPKTQNIPKILEIIIDPQKFNIAEQKKSLNWLKNQNPPHVIILFRILSYQSAFLKTDWFKYLEQQHVVITCWSILPTQISDYIRYTLRQDYPDFEITPTAVQRLTQLCQIYFSPLAIQQFSRVIEPWMNGYEKFPSSDLEWSPFFDYFKILLTQQSDLISPDQWIEAIFQSKIAHIEPYLEYLLNIQRLEPTLLLYLLHQMISQLREFKTNSESSVLKNCTYKQQQLLKKHAHSFSMSLLDGWLSHWAILDSEFKHLESHTSTRRHKQLTLTHIALSLASRHSLAIKLTSS